MTHQIQRLKMAMDGWSAQFDPIPGWRPTIRAANDGVYLDSFRLSTRSEVLTGVTIQIEGITVYIDEIKTGKPRKAIVDIRWEYNNEPCVAKIEFEDLPYTESST